MSRDFFKALTILLCCLCLTTNLNAHQSRINKPNKNSKTLLRGKVLGGFLLEDLWWLNATVGIEYRHKEKQSIGADYIFLKEWQEYDLFDSITHEELTHGFSKIITKHTFLTDYRFYWDPRFAERNRLSFYLSLYNRLTRFRMRSEDGFLFKENDIMKSSGYFIDPGIAIGVRNIGAKQNWFGVDFNVGLSKRFQQKSYQKFIDDNTSEYINNKKTERLVPSIRFNCYFYLRQRAQKGKKH